MCIVKYFINATNLYETYRTDRTYFNIHLYLYKLKWYVLK